MPVALLRAIVLLVACCAAAPAATGANLLANPDFDTDASGWMHYDPDRVSHVNEGVPPGALRFESDACCTQHAVQCIAVEAGVRYDLGGFFRQGAVQEPPGDGIGMDLQWFSDAACSVYPQQGIHNWSWTEPVGSEWTLRADLDLLAPPGSQSALVRIRQYNFSGQADFVSFADAVFFQRAPGIFADGFDD